MNRIYQGRVTSVEVPSGNKDIPWKAVGAPGGKEWQEALWAHHVLFQDAVNYYIVALAALGTSPGSNLAELSRLLEPVWEGHEKKGQKREGMGRSMQRAWKMEHPPTLAEALERFQKPLIADGVESKAAELAGEYLLFKLGGDAAIQQGGRTFLPMFCDPDSKVTFNLSSERRGRAESEELLKIELHRELADEEIQRLAAAITLGSVVNLQPGAEPDRGEAVMARLKAAATTFAEDLPTEEFQGWMKSLKGDFALPKNRGGNINGKRVDACALSLAFPNQRTKRIFQGTFPPPRPTGKKSDGVEENSRDESRFLASGDDPIKVARGKRGIVFPAFTALGIWNGDGRRPTWKESDIAAFKEALKVYSQFKQNRENRASKLNASATRLLWIDGAQAIQGYDASPDNGIRGRLQTLWDEGGGQTESTRRRRRRREDSNLLRRRTNRSSTTNRDQRPGRRSRDLKKREAE